MNKQALNKTETLVDVLTQIKAIRYLGKLGISCERFSPSTL